VSIFYIRANIFDELNEAHTSRPTGRWL